jgi:cytochrome b6-f complex iron-sulfur subunit
MEETTQRPKNDSTRTRRGFITWLSRAFLGLWGLGAIGVVAAYMKPKTRGHRLAERSLSAGMVDDFPIGEVRLIRHGDNPVFVGRLDAETFTALSAICTHLRCVLEYDRDSKSILCPCHDGRFDLAGTVLAGPPPRPLRSYRVNVRAGEVIVTL